MGLALAAAWLALTAEEPTTTTPYASS
jgi:hypothetical protein